MLWGAISKANQKNRYETYVAISMCLTSVVSISPPGWPVPWSYRGGADWSVVTRVHLIFLSKNRHGVAIFLITKDYLDFWSMMESSLETGSVHPLRAMGYIISGSMDIHIFRFLIWCLTWSSLMMERTSLPIPWLKTQGLKRCDKSDHHWKLR